jgi:hypothetical protein
MTSFARTLLAGMSAVAVAALAPASRTVFGRALPAALPVRSSAPGPDEPIVVCVGPDSVMRAAIGTTCPTGQSLVHLDCVGCNSADESSAPSAAKIDNLQRRLANVHKSALFTVVDKRDSPIFRVSEDRVSVYFPNAGVVRRGKSGRVPSERLFSNSFEAASIGDDSVLAARSRDGQFVTRLGAPGVQPRFWIEEGGLTRLEMGKNAFGGYSLKIDGGAGPIAGIGESSAGTGAVIIGDTAGRPRASMLIGDDGKAIVGVSNSAGAAVVALTEGASGGGSLTIGDAGSKTMVKMGVKDDHYGYVLTGPGAGFPYVPRSGLPGSYFLGCAPGPACAP